MEREPQFKDRVRLPDDDGEGEIVGMAQTVKGWYVGVKPDNGAPLWKGMLSEVELLEALGEEEAAPNPLRRHA